MYSTPGVGPTIITSRFGRSVMAWPRKEAAIGIVAFVSSGVVTGIERLPSLVLTCDAADSDGDGIPDLPADSASVAHLTAKTNDGTNTEITFRTTRGSLNQRTVSTREGSATVELRAAGETVAVTVTATAPGYRAANLNMEFVPIPAQLAGSR